MNPTLQAVTPAEHACLRELFQHYVYDLSELFGLDVGEDGRFHAPPLDATFTDPRRSAFLLRAGAPLAGFAVVRRGSRLSEDEDVYDMAEFFVLRRFRGQGVGGRAAASLFERFRGRWEVRERIENAPATAFWRRAIGRYTGGRFEEVVLDDARWRGPVQRFVSE